MRVANIVPSSLVNGEGNRLVIVFSGCSLNCKGCFSKELQNYFYGNYITITELVDEVIKTLDKYKGFIDGITLSGGNPQEQSELTLFLKELHNRVTSLDVWMWSGFTWDEIQADKEKKEHLNYINTIITGRYMPEYKVENEYCGSSNQEVWRKENDIWKKTEK